jgi:hypothetical protein
MVVPFRKLRPEARSNMPPSQSIIDSHEAMPGSTRSNISYRTLPR